MTSAQAKNHPDRLAFSPMHVHERTFTEAGEVYVNYEAFWQSRKKLRGIPMASTKAWWRAQKKARRRHPKMLEVGVEHCEDPRFPDERMDYETSRRKLYVPDYCVHFLANSPRLQQLRALDGDVVVLDYDGPYADGAPACREVTVDLLREKLADLSRPFGHGFLVAAALAGIAREDWM